MKSKAPDSGKNLPDTKSDKEYIGEQVRRLRTRRGLSVRGLAKLAGISPSYLSALERGLESPSLKISRTLAEVLNVPFFAILGGAHKLPAINRASERARLRFPSSSVEYEIVSLHPARDLQIYIGHLAPGCANTSDPVGHGISSQECLFILSGQATVILGEQQWELGQGDSMYFDASVPHRIVAGTSEPVSFLSITNGEVPGWGEQPLGRLMASGRHL